MTLQQPAWLRSIDTLIEWSGRLVAWLTLGMVLVTFVVVVMRYLLNLGSIATQESVTYMHAAVFMLGAAYTLRHGGHVRVDIFYQKMSTRRRAWVDLFGTLLLLFPTCAAIIWMSWDYVIESWKLRESSMEAGGLPLVFVLKTVIPLGAALLVLQGLVDVARNLLSLVRPRG